MPLNFCFSSESIIYGPYTVDTDYKDDIIILRLSTIRDYKVYNKHDFTLNNVLLLAKDHLAKMVADKIMFYNQEKLPYVECKISGLGAAFIAQAIAEELRFRILDYCTMPRKEPFFLRPIFNVSCTKEQKIGSCNSYELIEVRLFFHDRIHADIDLVRDFGLEEILSHENNEDLNPRVFPLSSSFGTPNLAQPLCTKRDNRLVYEATNSWQYICNGAWPLIKETASWGPKLNTKKVRRIDVAIASHQSQTILNELYARLAQYHKNEKRRFPIPIQFYYCNTPIDSPQSVTIYRDFPNVENSLEPNLLIFHHKEEQQTNKDINKACGKINGWRYQAKPKTFKRIVFISHSSEELAHHFKRALDRYCEVYKSDRRFFVLGARYDARCALNRGFEEFCKNKPDCHILKFIEYRPPYLDDHDICIVYTDNLSVNPK